MGDYNKLYGSPDIFLAKGMIKLSHFTVFKKWVFNDSYLVFLARKFQPVETIITCVFILHI